MKITKQDLVNAEINGCNTADSIWNYLISTKYVKQNYGMFIGMIFVVFGLFMLYGLSIKNDYLIIHLVSLLSFMFIGIFIYMKSNNKTIIDKLSEWLIIPTAMIFCFSIQYFLDYYDILVLEDPKRIFYLKLDFINIFILSVISLFFFYKDRNHLVLTTAFIGICFLIDIVLKGSLLSISGSIYDSVLYNKYEVIRNNSIILFSFVVLVFGMFKFSKYMTSLKYISYIPLISFTNTIYNTYNSSNEIFSIIISLFILALNYFCWKDKSLNFLIIIGVIFKLFMYNHYDFDSLETLVILTLIFGYSLKNEYNKLAIFTFLIITFTIENIIDLKDVYQIIYYILIGISIILFMFLSKKYNIKNPLKKINN